MKIIPQQKTLNNKDSFYFGSKISKWTHLELQITGIVVENPLKSIS